MTKVAGAHTLKAGFYFEHVTNAQPGSGNSNGEILNSAAGVSTTGNTFADILLGRMEHYDEQSKNALHDLGFNKYEGFVQDSWKLRSNLTVDVGVRALVRRLLVRPPGQRHRRVRLQPVRPGRSRLGVPRRRLSQDRSERAAVGGQGHAVLCRLRASASRGTRGAKARPCYAADSASSGTTTRCSRTMACSTLAPACRSFSCDAPDCPSLGGPRRAWARATSSSAAPRSTSATRSSRSPTAGARRSTSGFRGR